MCGIAGYFGSSEIDSNSIEACLELMRRRGPDSKGSFHHKTKTNKNLYLLHTRLSILDIDPRSNQPFNFDPFVFVFNGELYNHIELKSPLRSRGHSFSTTSDTEVFIKILAEFGWEALDQCEGMWAFALYNTQTGTLLLSRDRFGEKPLYLYRDATGIYFGSEIKFIFCLRGGKTNINFNHLYRYLVNGYKALYKGREAFSEGIEQLPSSSVLLIDAKGNESQFKYWAPKFEPDDSIAFEDAVDRVRELLIKSVKLRLRADVPLAFCMSGGVDSNSLLSIAKKKFNYEVHGFTIANTDARYEEKDIVEQVVKELKIRHTSLPLKVDNFLPQLKTLVKGHDSPVYTINYYAHWLLMKEVAAGGYRVSISGTAADELLTGYYDHHLAYLYEVREDPQLYEESVQNWEKHIFPLVRNPFLKNPRLFLDNPSFRDHIFLNAGEFSECLKVPWQEPFKECDFAKSLLRNRMLNEMFYESIPVILHEDDLNAMYYSIENRSPFLDRELFEFCYKIPSRHLIRRGYIKAILREAMRGIVPECVLTEHRKVGFNAPIFSFLDVNDPSVKEYLLDSSPIYEHVKKEHIEKIIQKDYLLNSESKFLFRFLSSKIFLEEFGA